MADKSLEEVKRGEQAAVILENPVYQEAIKKVKDGIIVSMSTSPMGDEKTHNRLVIALQILHQIDKQLVDVMNTGKLAKIQTDTPRFKVFG
jgi:hypothetical protein